MPTHGSLTEQDISALRLEMSAKRAQQGLTYDALARKSGVSRRTIVSIETGSSRGALDSWMRIYDALDADFGATLQDLKNPLSVQDPRAAYPEMPLADYIVQEVAPEE